MFSEDRRVRVGTWNLDGRQTDRHVQLLRSAACDVCLLTEVNDHLLLPGYTGHLAAAHMRPNVRWAGVFSRLDIDPLPDPHTASAMARVDGITFVSSILPWKGSDGVDPWQGANHAERTRHALETLLGAMPNSEVCWGGDWNHAFSGPEYAGSHAGRADLAEAVSDLGLSVPTALLPHALDGLLSIDHIAVPSSWEVRSAERILGADLTGRLSDHDLYVVDAHAGRPNPRSTNESIGTLLVVRRGVVTPAALSAVARVHAPHPGGPRWIADLLGRSHRHPDDQMRDGCRATGGAGAPWHVVRREIPVEVRHDHGSSPS